MMSKTFDCAECGASAPYGRLSCPSCGALLASVTGALRPAFGPPRSRPSPIAGASRCRSPPPLPSPSPRPPGRTSRRAKDAADRRPSRSASDRARPRRPPTRRSRDAGPAPTPDRAAAPPRRRATPPSRPQRPPAPTTASIRLHADRRPKPGRTAHTPLRADAGGGRPSACCGRRRRRARARRPAPSTRRGRRHRVDPRGHRPPRRRRRPRPSPRRTAPQRAAIVPLLEPSAIAALPATPWAPLVEPAPALVGRPYQRHLASEAVPMTAGRPPSAYRPPSPAMAMAMGRDGRLDERWRAPGSVAGRRGRPTPRPPAKDRYRWLESVPEPERFVEIAGWFVVVGATMALLGFLLPWSRVVIGAEHDGGYFDGWGLASPTHLLVFVGLLGVLALALRRGPLSAVDLVGRSWAWCSAACSSDSPGRT